MSEDLEYEDWEEIMGAEHQEDEHEGAHYVLNPDDFRWFGMCAHRGILHPDDYWDEQEVLNRIQIQLGAKITHIQRIYGPGGLTAEDKKFRHDMDALFLKLAEAGGNMSLLGGLLGFTVRPEGGCRTMINALKRARAEEIS